ncbi:MAG TPA: hypothetical protein P5544_02955 [Candidatus Nanopelagicales bacterium]|nr:hypothetical protein [Candidatus Nanopelagicales bacterium]
MRTHQNRLNRLLAADSSSPALQEWAPTLNRLLPRYGGDPFIPVLAERLAAASRASLDTPPPQRRHLAGGVAG